MAPRDPIADEDATRAQSSDGGATDFVLFDLRALARFDAEKPHVVTLSETGSARLILITFRAGQALPEHQAGSEVCVQALRGRLRLSVGASSTELIAGRLAQLEAQTPYRLHALTDAVALLSLMPSPGESALAAALRGEASPLVTRV